MSAAQLDNVVWYSDPQAAEKDEPGICHSFTASLATALNHVTGHLDPVWLMGSSGFAFRLFVCETLCPSAMSIFNWSEILPEAVERSGRQCVYLSRMWDEEDVEEERREQAHLAIVEAIGNGAPAIGWDIANAEWGLITGYNEERRLYATLTNRGRPSTLPFERLGRNGIDILSVAIPGEPNQRSRDQIMLSSLQAAVDHAEGKEWTERPAYQNGLAGYDLWALVLDRWAMIVDAGRADRLPLDVPDHAGYYAAIHYSARCYARDYIAALADGDEKLEGAARAYAEVASCLRSVWKAFPGERKPGADLLASLADDIGSARLAEEAAVNYLREYVTDPTRSVR